MSLSHAVPLSEKTFTQEHVELSKAYINPKVWPGLYNNKVLSKNFPGLKFKDRRVMAIKDIIYDIPEDQLDQYPSIMRGFAVKNKMMVQSARSNGRGNKAPEVWASIRQNGYVLSHIPMAACLMMDKKVYFNDGRTRLEELIAQGFTHVLVDYYECSDWHSFVMFSLYRNPTENPRSPQTLNDVITSGINEVTTGRLKNTQSDIEHFVKTVTNDAYGSQKFGMIVQGIQAGKKSTSQSFKEEEAKSWLTSMGYNNNENDNGIYYLVVSIESKTSTILAAANELTRLKSIGVQVKKLRLVINPGTLKGANPEKSWKDGADSFIQTHKESLNVIKDCYFNGTKLDNIIELYGIIPSVFSLAQEYPLDKLVIFDKIFSTHQKTFQDLGLSVGMTELIYGHKEGVLHE